MKKIYAVVALAVVLGWVGPALTKTNGRALVQSAVNSCQGALPSFEGALRKRPLALKNEGANSAFVTCGLLTHVSTVSGLGNVKFANIALRNASAGDVEVACTLANDQDLNAPGSEIFLTKTIGLRVNERNFIFWDFFENLSEAPFRLPAISCALPPGVEIEQTKTDFDVEVND